MRKINTLIIIFAVLFSVQSSFAQKTARHQTPFQNQEQAQDVRTALSEIISVSDNENGALIEWRTNYEKGNLGFNIYRLENGQQILINRGLVPGSAMLFGENKELPAGNSYNYFDPQGSLRSQYVIEAISLNGSIYSQVISTEYAGNVLDRAGSAATYQRGGDVDHDAQREYPAPLQTKEFIELNQAVQNSETQRWVAAQPGVKIGVKKDGFYRVTRTELQAAGFDVNAPTVNWQLYTDGIEQPIIVGGNGDYIEFYGRGVDVRMTDTKIYYLVVGNNPGKRIGFSRRYNGTRLTPATFNSTVFRKDRSNYITAILNGEEENFWGPLITNTVIPNSVLDLKAINTNGGQAIVRVVIQGYTLQAHNFKVTLNDTELGFITGNGRDVMQRTFTIPISLLNEGNNSIKVVGTAAGTDYGFVDSIQITYPRNYQADANSLTFTTAASRGARISGFSSPEVRVFDITDPNNTSLAHVQNEGNGNIFVEANRPRLMHAVGEGAIQQVASITANVPSSVLSTTQNKDLVIITHRTWASAAQNLASYRTGQGMSVAVVDIEDVLDECGFGMPSAQAIGTFLQAVQPDYALLFGDANADARNYRRSSSPNFVPSRHVDTLFQETTSDDALVDFNNDGIADFPIGRIPVGDLETANLIVNKIMIFEQMVGTALQTRGGVFICDEPNGYDFCGSADRLIAQLPSNTPVQRVRRQDGDIQVVRETIINQMNSGKFLAVYAGHGSLTGWSTGGNLFRSLDALALTNANNLNLFVIMNCLNGDHAHVSTDSLSEAMIKSPLGGSAAAWASSGQTFPDTQELMGLRFFQSWNTTQQVRIGDAIRTAKLATPDRDVRLSWNLIGDPTMRIK